jgi:hypothetical protein
MADIATLQAQLDAVKSAYRSGTRTLQYEGRQVVYATGEEMRAVIASLESEIAQATGTMTPTVGMVRSDKGY